MSDMFIYLLFILQWFGKIKSATIYSDDFATIEAKNGNKVYSISIRCAEDKDGER